MKITLLLFILIAAAITRIPIVGKYFSIVNTLIHELGHAFMAILTGGRVDKIQLFSNTEGTAWTSNRFWFGRVLTSVAGYVFASLVSCVFLYFISVQKYNFILYTLVFFLVIALLFWVRNLYGLFWMATFCTIFGLLIWYDQETLTMYVLLFICATIFVQSIYSAWVILYLSFKTPSNAGDASNLAKFTFIFPTQIWGIFFSLQSLYFGFLGLSFIYL